MQFPLADRISASSTASRVYAVKTAQFGDGYEEVRPSDINFVREEWSIKWSSLSLDEYQQLMSVLDSGGGHTKYTWTPHGEAAPKTYRVSGKVQTSSNGKLIDVVAAIKRVY